MTDLIVPWQFPDNEHHQLVVSRYDHRIETEQSMSETATPPTSNALPPPDVYHSTLVRALGFQLSFVVLAGLLLDGGVFLRCYTAVAIGYWIAAVGVLVTRPGNWGLRYLRYGVVLAFGLAVIVDSCWHEWVVGFFGDRR